MASSSALSGGLSSMTQLSYAARNALTPCRPGRAWRLSAAATDLRVTEPSTMNRSSAAGTAPAST